MCDGEEGVGSSWVSMFSGLRQWRDHGGGGGVATCVGLCYQTRRKDSAVSCVDQNSKEALLIALQLTLQSNCCRILGL